MRCRYNAFKYVLIAMAIAVNACRKEPSATLPESVNFVLMGKAGKSLVTSVSDSVKIDYTENGVLKYQRLKIWKLTDTVFYGDTAYVRQKYNSLVINDGKFMSNLSSRKSDPIHDFHIYLNGVNMGSIYLDYWNVLKAFPAPSSRYLKFNNIPVTDDRENHTLGSNFFLLQVQ